MQQYSIRYVGIAPLHHAPDSWGSSYNERGLKKVMILPGDHRLADSSDRVELFCSD